MDLRKSDKARLQGGKEDPRAVQAWRQLCLDQPWKSNTEGGRLVEVDACSTCDVTGASGSRIRHDGCLTIRC